MDFNTVNNLMHQQLGALRNLDELLYIADTQGIPDTILQEDMDLFKDHVLRLKKVCETASAISHHYQAIEKTTNKVEPASDDDSGDGGDEVHPLEGTLKAKFDEAVKESPKEKKTRVRKPKVEPDPVEEEDDDDDLDDLLS